MKWEIRYYYNETNYRFGIVSYKETIFGDRSLAVNMAMMKVNSGIYKYFDIIPL